ncbi:hypothetical protein ACOSP7_016328 [Xanthoceras sorbifolium]|uniref:Uncharacterized protein n=1 Tax=Xanthoceras sorbifolium TaxID=99658 RepID=A0ABQ8HJ61_9ROSI|nr:hypothetical protein JRO89_XS10G0173800 [Xanthoceras sorbifolium]
MAKLRTSGKKNNGIVKLKIVVQKLQKSLLLGKKSSSYEETRGSSSNNQVPEDVKEGHLAVLAVDGDQPKRFIVPLIYLTHPTFLRLLEQSAEEYGFDREGALTIPCRPCELERILSEQWQEEEEEGDSSATSTVSVKWSSCNSIIQSC